MKPLPPPQGCEDFASLLEARFDGELEDPAAVSALEAHLEECPACRDDLEGLSALREGLQGMPRAQASVELRDAVRDRMAPTSQGTERQEWLVRVLNRPVRALAVAAVMLVMVGGVWLTFRSYRPGPLFGTSTVVRTPSVEEHITLVENDDGAFLETRDASELQAWLSGQLNFLPPVPSWSWAQLSGGRVCKIRGRQVARLQYDVEGRPFTLFVQHHGAGYGSSTYYNGETAALSSQRDFKTAYWCADGFSYVLVAEAATESVFENLKKEK